MVKLVVKNRKAKIRKSETDLSAFTLDKWIAIYTKATQIQKEKQTKFVSKTNATVVHAVKYTEITASLGVPWISEHIVNEFMYWIFQLAGSNRYTQARYEAITGAWSILYKNDHNSNLKVTNVYGTSRYNGLQILEAILNKRSIQKNTEQ